MQRKPKTSNLKRWYYKIQQWKEQCAHYSVVQLSEMQQNFVHNLDIHSISLTPLYNWYALHKSSADTMCTVHTMDAFSLAQSIV